jgi:hypothetical protein
LARRRGEVDIRSRNAPAPRIVARLAFAARRASSWVLPHAREARSAPPRRLKRRGVGADDRRYVPRRPTNQAAAGVVMQRKQIIERLARRFPRN